jgi:hypothetical protein
MAKDTKKASPKKKGGKGAASANPETDPVVIRLWTSRGRAWGSLIGFFVVAFVSYRAGIGPTDAAFRGLIGGIAFSFVGWGCALLVLTGLLRTAAQTLVDEERKAAEAAAAARAEAMAQTASTLHPRDRFAAPPSVEVSDFTPEPVADV